MSGYELLAFPLVMLLAILVLNKAGRYGEQQLARYQADGLQRFFNGISETGKPPEAYRYFSNGHPYVWVELDLGQAMDKVRFSCIGYKGASVPAQFQMKIDQVRMAVYILPSQRDTWDGLMHYDEWIASNRVYEQRIAQYNREQERLRAK